MWIEKLINKSFLLVFLTSVGAGRSPGPHRLI
jgi:hypothetical protein